MRRVSDAYVRSMPRVYQIQARCMPETASWDPSRREGQRRDINVRSGVRERGGGVERKLREYREECRGVQASAKRFVKGGSV